MEDTILKNSRSRYSPVKVAKKSHQRCLDYSGYNLTSVPKELFGTPFDTSLQSLDLSNNGIADLPSEISFLKNLTTLILSGNKIQVLPGEIKFLSKLRKLDLSRNQLCLICEEINSLKNLEEVNLNGNDLKKIPCYLLSLPKLTKVFCIRNERLENVPREIAVQGLEAMREYLSVKVETYENFEEEKIKDRIPKKLLDSFLGEIEKDWTLQNDQYARKTKDACTEFDANDLILLGNPDQSYNLRGIKSPERCFSTQTDPIDCETQSSSFEIKLPDKEQRKSSLLLGDTNIFGSNTYLNENENSEDKSVGKLVKIFHKQLDLVSEEKMRILLNQEKRQQSKQKAGHSQQFIIGDNNTMHVNKCGCCGLKKKESVTSEYGSLSAYSIECLSKDSLYGDTDSCYGNEGSMHDSSFSDGEIDDEGDDDDDDSTLSKREEASFWSQNRYLSCSKELVIIQCGVELTIPELNLSGHSISDFSFEIVTEKIDSPLLSSNSAIVTPVVRAMPHGAKFYSQQPAIVKLPLNIVTDETCVLRCYESDTDVDDAEEWKEIADFDISGGFISIRTNHFSLFCATVSKNYPHVKKTIPSSQGCKLALHEVPGLEVAFPDGCLDDQVTANMTALYDDPQYAPKNTNKPLASPIVALGPSGRTFKDDVIVTLPLNNAKEVFAIAGNPTLTIMQSQTDLEEKPKWKKLRVEYTINNENDMYTVSFKVRHFTLFSSSWNVLDSAVDKVKRAVSFLFPGFTHLVYFQALMGDCNRKNQFGLYVFCHRAGEPPITDCNGYQMQVGRTGQKQLKAGNITLNLKSSLFVADNIAGETEEGMQKTENFNGNSFDKQFNLRFLEPFHGGPFGKVFVRGKDQHQNISDVFDFNLEKSIGKRSRSLNKEPNEWESNSVKEIAGLLSIEDRWIDLGLTLGYTRPELKRKFTDLDDPIQAIQADFKERGGEANTFISAMYQVSRTFKLIPYDQMMENRENRRIENRINPASSSRFCECPLTPERSPLRSIKRKLTTDFEGNGRKQYTEVQLDSIAEEIIGDWKRVGLKLGLETKRIAEIDQNNRHENEREKAFQMLLTWREQQPDRCCADTFCEALRKCQLNYTAQRCSAT
eukprot:gene8753-9688_t